MLFAVTILVAGLISIRGTPEPGALVVLVPAGASVSPKDAAALRLGILVTSFHYANSDARGDYQISNVKAGKYVALIEAEFRTDEIGRRESAECEKQFGIKNITVPVHCEDLTVIDGDPVKLDWDFW